MPTLTAQNGSNKGRIFEFGQHRVTVGRSSNSDIQIVDRRMSRQHVEIFREGGAHFLRDLASRNGTLVNGEKIDQQVRLTPGDLIQLGDTALLFDDDSTPMALDLAVLTPPARKKSREAGSYRLVEERQWGTATSELRAGVATPSAPALDTHGGKALRDSSKCLEILYQVTDAIRSIFDLDDLLERIMDLVWDVFNPDRAYILTVHPESGDLRPEIIRVGDVEGETQEARLSMSIVQRCMSERISLLVSDARSDDRFSKSDSVVEDQIRTAMAAPLIYKLEPLGVIYLDTTQRIVPFSQPELELLTGITNQAAMAIVNARMHGQMLEQHKMAREMEIARTIQMNLLPRLYPRLAGCEISAMSLPAKHVGGDYYDFLDLPDGRVCLAIADVSGKGVPAAILAATTRSYIRSEIRHPASTIDETVTRINRMVFQDVMNDMYVTLALAYLDAEEGHIDYVNAGHAHPILIRKDGSLSFLDRGGLFLGIIEDNQYDSGTLHLTPGDTVVFYTDGVTDIQDENGKAYGAERLHRLLVDHRHLPAEEIRNAIYKACLTHRAEAEQFDDFTLIVLRRTHRLDTPVEDMDMD